MIRPIVVAAIAAYLMLSPPAQAQNLKDEIEVYIINLCVLAAVRHNQLDDMLDEDMAVATMKILMADALLEVNTAISDLLRGRDTDTRMALYPVLRGLCIEAMLKGG